MSRDVAVTGIGVVSAAGVGVEALWEAIERQASPVRLLRSFDASLMPVRIAAEVDGFDPTRHLEARRLRRLDRFSQFAVCAAAMALTDAALDARSLPPDRAGVYIGSALGGVAYGEDQHGRYADGGLRAVNPLLALSVFNGAGATNVAQEFDLRGPVLSSANSCAAGAIAIGEAATLVRAGRADVMLAGGSEAPLAPLTFGAFALIRAMSRRNDDPAAACRPFDVARDGFVMGEGACVLVLEDAAHAAGRGARVYGILAGYGTTNDAHHMTEPRPDGQESARAISIAMDQAAAAPADLDYVNAHASSTPLNDTTEALALHRALGPTARRVPVSGTKPYTGHALGATGAIEAAICLLAMQRRRIPPTLNLDSPDPAIDLQIVTRFEPRPVDAALSTSFGFGGSNAALVFRRPA